jgi:hypothetical protein
VPDQIVSAFVPKLKLYRFWCREGRFTELLRILEKHGAVCQIHPVWILAWRRQFVELLSIACAEPNSDRRIWILAW